MIYTVGEAAKILKVAPSTIRYYDKEGLLPFVERSDSGIRVFHEQDLNWLFIIECLKKSGLSIKDIKSYIDMSLQGDETIYERLKIFQKQRKPPAQRLSRKTWLLKKYPNICAMLKNV